jgi:multidrug transporter EmrE-like cation transporter
MNSPAFLLVLLTALMTVAGNLMMREGVVRAGGLSLALPSLASELVRLAQQPLFDLGFLLYGLASLVWFRIVSTENLNTSYPLLVSLTFVFVTLGATLLFREPVTIQKVTGIGVILFGIVLVASAG